MEFGQKVILYAAVLFLGISLTGPGIIEVFRTQSENAKWIPQSIVVKKPD